MNSSWLKLRRSMAGRRSVRVLLLLFTALSLFAFIPIIAFLPDLSSSSSSRSLRHGSSSVTAQGFKISDDMFWKDNKPFQIIGGDVHYFRILPQYWEDRLLRAKALGLNTVQTYVPWNLHEPSPQNWSFEGIADFESYLKLAHKLGLLVMLRVGPYICGEWDLGGFPAWILAIEPAVKLRSSDPKFLQLLYMSSRAKGNAKMVAQVLGLFFPIENKRMRDVTSWVEHGLTGGSK